MLCIIIINFTVFSGYFHNLFKRISIVASQSSGIKYNTRQTKKNISLCNRCLAGYGIMKCKLCFSALICSGLHAL